MREFWAFIFVSATLFAAFATAMLIVIAQTGHDMDVAGITTGMVVAGWIISYLSWRFMRAIPKKKDDIW